MTSLLDTSFEVPKKESKRPNTESTSVSGIRRINAKPQFLQMEDGTVEKNSKVAGLLSPYFSTPINLASLDCRHTSFNMSPIHSKSSAEPKVEVFPNPSNLGREVVENSAEFRTGVKRRLDESPKKWNPNKQKLGPKVIFSSFPSKTKADLIQNNFDFSFDETSSVVSSRGKYSVFQINWYTDHWLVTILSCSDGPLNGLLNIEKLLKIIDIFCLATSRKLNRLLYQNITFKSCISLFLQFPKDRRLTTYKGTDSNHQTSSELSTIRRCPNCQQRVISSFLYFH